MALLVSILMLGVVTIFISAIHFNETENRRLTGVRKYIDPPPLKNTPLDLVIVYNGFMYPQRHNWLSLMKEQLDEFNCNGMASRAKHFYISLAMNHTSELDKTAAEITNHTIEALSKIIPKATFDITLENRYEYPGIRAVWDVANSLSAEEAENTVVVYMHSKGMVNHGGVQYGSRMASEVELFHATFDSWNAVLDKFHREPKLNKAGCVASPDGFIWINIFYARASFVQKLVNPTISTHRWYYEMWLSKVDPHHFWRTSGKVRHIEFADQDIQNRNLSSSCADCWSICAEKEELGVVFKADDVGNAATRPLDWYKCREETVLPFIDYFKGQEQSELHDISVAKSPESNGKEKKRKGKKSSGLRF